MWPRIVEVALGVWLLISPFVFGHEADEVARWTTDLACGTAVIVLALASLWQPLRQIHLVSIAIGLWLIGNGFVAAPSPPPPALQNHVVVGLLLLMFAILPNDATEPPPGWREFYRNR